MQAHGIGAGGRLTPPSTAVEPAIPPPQRSGTVPPASPTVAPSTDAATVGEPKATPPHTPVDAEVRERLQQTLDELHQQLDQHQRDIAFSIDRVTEQYVITVTSRDSGEVVRQIPIELFAEMTERTEQLKGWVLNEKP